jgi:hypothetical protein
VRAPERAITLALEAVVMHTLAKDPRHRYATAATLAIAIAQARKDGDNIEATAPERAYAGMSGEVSAVRNVEVDAANHEIGHAPTLPGPEPSRRPSSRPSFDPPNKTQGGSLYLLWGVVIAGAIALGVWAALRS